MELRLDRISVLKSGLFAGFIVGIIGAAIYTLVARIMGGLQFTTSQVVTTPPLGIPGATPPASRIG